jgi:hypothetical protein
VRLQSNFELWQRYLFFTYKWHKIWGISPIEPWSMAEATECTMQWNLPRAMRYDALNAPTWAKSKQLRWQFRGFLLLMYFTIIKSWRDTSICRLESSPLLPYITVLMPLLSIIYSRIRKQITPWTHTLSFPAPHSDRAKLKSARRSPHHLSLMYLWYHHQSYRNYGFLAKHMYVLAVMPRGQT